MKYKIVEWYHWLWLWLWTTETTMHRDRRGSKVLTTTIKYKNVFGMMYVIDTKYSKSKEKRNEKSTTGN